MENNKMPTDDHRYIWMIMLYLAGDNNLSDEMVWALKELNSITLPDGIAVTIQFDPETLLQVGALLMAGDELIGHYHFDNLKLNPTFDKDQFAAERVK